MNDKTGIEEEKADTSIETLKTEDSQGSVQKELPLGNGLLKETFKAISTHIADLKKILKIDNEEEGPV